MHRATKQTFLLYHPSDENEHERSYAHSKTLKSHHTAPAAALRTVCRLCLDSHGAQLFKRQLEELSSHGRALHVLVYAHFLRYLQSLLWIDDTVGVILGPQVPLQTNNRQWQRTLGPMEGRADLFDPLVKRGSQWEEL